VKVFPGWLDLEVAQRDPTWTEIVSELCKHETVLGVHEDLVGIREGSFVVLEDSLILFLPNDSTSRIAFRDIASWDRLCKEPPSRSLWITTSSRDRLELKFSRGCPFAFIQFIGRVIDQIARDSSRR